MDNIGLKGVLAQKSGSVPDLVMALFQGMFAAFTPAIVIGAAAERGRILPCIVFVFIWSTIVYDPIASWTWNSLGWAYNLGVLDFAGGTPVHITSGAAALAFALILGPRQEKLNSKVYFHLTFS
jgi:Amt family ammonium transporter